MVRCAAHQSREPLQVRICATELLCHDILAERYATRSRGSGHHVDVRNGFGCSCILGTAAKLKGLLKQGAALLWRHPAGAVAKQWHPR